MAKHHNPSLLEPSLPQMLERSIFRFNSIAECLEKIIGKIHFLLRFSEGMPVEVGPYVNIALITHIIVVASSTSGNDRKPRGLDL
jgi:hypothetical protein